MSSGLRNTGIFILMPNSSTAMLGKAGSSSQASAWKTSTVITIGGFSMLLNSQTHKVIINIEEIDHGFVITSFTGNQLTITISYYSIRNYSDEKKVINFHQCFSSLVLVIRIISFVSATYANLHNMRPLIEMGVSSKILCRKIILYA